MNKQFAVKVYNLNWTFKKTLTGRDVIDWFSFTSQINGGQWEGILVLNKEFSSSDIVVWDVVRIYVYTDTYPNGRNIYTGYISRLTRKYSTSKNIIEYNMIGLASMLSFVYFNSSGYIFNKNQDPAQTIKDVIDYFNSQYGGSFFSYSGGGVQNYGSSVSLDFNYTKSLAAINQAVETTNFWWRIDADGQTLFKPTPTSTTHTFTAGKDVVSIDLQESSEQIINRHIVEWQSWTTSPNNNASSISTYWLRELKESKKTLANLSSATTYSNNYLNQWKDLKKITSISINNKYNLENIYPGDTIKILNLDYKIDGLQIKKVSYTPEFVKLELEVLEGLWSTIFNS